MTSAWPADFARPTLLILQATPFCNIDCDYCYLPHRTDRRTLPLATLDRLVDRLLEADALGPKLRVTWHVGEPLAMRREAFADYCALLRERLGPHTALTLNVQTNGMLIDDAWIDLFRRYNVRLGLSLDGPERFHDAHRRDRRGRGTHAAVMKAVQRLHDAGFEFGIICVMDEGALGAPDEMFDFFTQNDLNIVSFSLEESAGVHESRVFQQANLRDLSRAFFRRYFERVAAHPRPHWVRELNGILEAVRYPHSEIRAQVTQAGRVLSMDWQGNVSTFSPELLTWAGPDADTFKFANVHTQPLADLAQSVAFQTTRRAIDLGVSACKSACQYYRYCGGGVPSAKLSERGRFDCTQTLYCETKVQASVDAFLDVLVDRAGALPFRDAGEFPT